MSTTAHIEWDGQPVDEDRDDLEALFAEGTHDPYGNRLGAQGSPLRGLAATRQRAQQTREVKRLRVSGYDRDGFPPLYVRYHKISDDAFQQIVGKLGRRRGSNAGDANCDLLIQACDGIYFLDVDAPAPSPDDGDPHAGRELCPDPADPHAELPKFDRRLRGLLEVTINGTARDAVRALFFDRPGEIAQHAERLTEWMGYISDDGAEIDPS